MSWTRTRRTRVVVAAALASLLLLGPPAGADQHITPIASGFDGPLGLAIGQDGTVYVAEAFAGQVTTFPLRSPGDRSVLTRSPGLVGGVAAQGKGKVFHTSTGQDATLQRVQPNGRSTTVASLSSYEERVNPDGGQVYGFLEGSLDTDCAEVVPDALQGYAGVVESNPYAVAIDGSSTLVADAAGNTLLRVAANGRVSTVAVLPPVPQVMTQDAVDAWNDNDEAPFLLPDCVVGAVFTGEFVPTDVEVGPDGHYYVTSLPGLPEAPGAASVWRVHRSTGQLTMLADGLAYAVDLAVAADGTVYVAELFADRISAIRGGQVEVVAQAPLPGALEIGPDGALYATIGTFFPVGDDGSGGASVVRITP
jgi:sugar lactone lactonase YvrE